MAGRAVRWAGRLAGVALATGLLSGVCAAEGPGDPVRGAKVYEDHCSGCHSVTADRVGPRHGGLFGRPAGSAAGYEYSPALRSSNVVWNATTLDQWLGNPESLIPGQRMGYRLADAELRADVIAYLATLAGS